MIGDLNASVSNQYLPLYPRIYTRTLARPSNWYTSPFFIRATKARWPYDREVSLENLYLLPTGNQPNAYNLHTVNNAILATGRINNLFPSEYWNFGNLFFSCESRIAAEGMQVGYEYAITDHVSAGFLTSVLHVNSALIFTPTADLRNALGIPLNNNTLQGRMREVYNGYLNVYNILGLQAPEWSGSGFGDTDIYVRFGKRAEYRFKLRRLDVGIRIGAIVPTNVPREYSNPASISLGYPFAGFSVQPEGEFELKHDWIFGIWLRVEKRFKRTFMARVSTPELEPANFGAITGLFSVKPGVTIAFSPYFRLTDMIEGLGAQLQYVYVRHKPDNWTDLRSDQTFPAKLQVMHDISDWTDSHLSGTVFLDLNKTKFGYVNAPEFFLEILGPINILSPERVAKSLRINLGFEFNF